MSDSPESFSSTRPNAGAAGAAAGWTTASMLGDGVPGVVEQLDPALLQHLRDRARRLVGAVPLLLGQHRLGVEPLVQHPLDDPLADVLRLRLDLVRILEDLALGLDE